MKKLKITFNSPAVLCFALVSGAALILNRLTGGAANRLVFSTYRASLLSPGASPRSRSKPISRRSG